MSGEVFTYERLPDRDAVEVAIRECEGHHVQQVAYSSYMGALTQICFTEQVVRSVIEWDGSQSWVPKR